MAHSLMRSGLPWRAAAAVLGGIIIGLLAFWLTSLTPTYSYLGPLGRGETVREAGFDPWTGLPHGSTYVLSLPVAVCESASLTIAECAPHEVSEGPPADLIGRRAIPLPVGTAVGIGLMLTVVALAARLDWWPATRP